MVVKKRVFLFLSTILRIFHLPLLSLNGISKNLWVFGARSGLTYDDNSRHLFEYICKNHKEIHAVWISKNPQVIQYLRQHNYKVYHTFSFRGIICIFLAHVTFVNVYSQDITPFKFLLTKKINVQLWHGTPMRQNNLSDIQDSYDMVSVASLDFLTNQALGCPVKFNFVLTGYPRNDLLIKSRSSQTNSDRIRLLYMPTHRQRVTKSGEIASVSFDMFNYGFDLNHASRCLIKNNAVLQLKLHPLQSLPDEVINEIRDSEVIQFIEKDCLADIYDNVAKTDILITDYSSILFDYLLLNRPVFLTPFDLKEQDDIRSLRFPYSEIVCGPVSYDWAQFFNQLEEYFSNGDTYASIRESVRDRFNYYNDSNSSERVVNLIKERIKS